MNVHAAFDFDSEAGLRRAAKNLGLNLPWRDDIGPLFEKLPMGNRTLPNRLAVLPMEGADAYPNGTPSERTVRRYLRFAEGGSGMIWFEACAVQPEARSNPRQLMLTGENLGAYQSLLSRLRKAARARFGESHEIFCGLQLTHAGRYALSGPQRPRPVIGFNPYLDRRAEDVMVLEDADLDRLQETYLSAARLALHAGFDAVDIKSCHGYLLNELLGAYFRSGSRYGKSFENRTRFLTEVVQAIHANLPQLVIAVRLSGFDGIPFPYGFGFTRDSALDIDLTELTALIRRLLLLGCTMFGISAGNPRRHPHLTRPYDRAAEGSPLPEEHPLEGVMRLLNVTGGLQRRFPNVPIIGAGYSWLRSYFPHVAAAQLASGNATLVGLGRSSLAYPAAPRDLIEKGRLDPDRVCISCSRCSELLSRGRNTGCVIHDAEIYAGEYQKPGSPGPE